MRGQLGDLLDIERHVDFIYYNPVKIWLSQSSRVRCAHHLKAPNSTVVKFISNIPHTVTAFAAGAAPTL